MTFETFNRKEESTMNIFTRLERGSHKSSKAQLTASGKASQIAVPLGEPNNSENSAVQVLGSPATPTFPFGVSSRQVARSARTELIIRRVVLDAEQQRRRLSGKTGLKASF